jgi:LCP family protein required for cell wall assembly
MINSLLQIGGPTCLWKTVEQVTGIRINHFIGIGMLGFVKVVNDLGGVNVCVPYKVNDPVSGLDLKAGEQHITASRRWPSGAPGRTSGQDRTWSGSSATSSCPRRW